MPSNVKIDVSALGAAMNKVSAAVRQGDSEELASASRRSGSGAIKRTMLDLDMFPPSWTGNLSLDKKLTELNQRWGLGMKFRRSWWLTRCVYDPDRNRDVSPWLSSRELSLWLRTFEVGLVYGWENGAHQVAEEVAAQLAAQARFERKLKDETT